MMSTFLYTMVTDLIISGAIGGLAANLFAKGIWNWYRRPVLEFDSIDVKKIYSRSNILSKPDEDEETKYLLKIRNTGKTAAENCRAEIFISGTFYSPYHEEHKDIMIRTPIVWSISLTPTESINADETTQLELFKINHEDDGTDTVQFPSHNGWKSPAPIQTSEAVDPRTETQLVLDDCFETISTTRSMVKITSENASSLSAQINFDFEPETPQLSLENQDQRNFSGPYTPIP